MASKKKVEVFSTNPIKVLYEGSFIGAKAVYETYKEEYLEKNQTLGVRVLNSYHWEWVGFQRFFGYTGINPENGTEHFVIDFDHEFNEM